MIIQNGLVWGDDFAFHEKDLYIDDATHTIVDKPVSEHEETGLSTIVCVASSIRCV